MVVKDVKFNCIQVNLQHALAASSAFSRRFELYNHKIGFIQEPYAKRMGDEYRINGISCGSKVYDKYNRPRLDYVPELCPRRLFCPHQGG